MTWLALSDGCALYFEEHGAGGSPLVLLEGLGGDVRGWADLLPPLAARHRVLVYDHRGNGRSGPPPTGATLALFADDLLRLLEDRGIDRAHLYGMSMGGKVAMAAALEHSERVSSLVLAATDAGRARRTPVARGATVPKGRPDLSLDSEAFARDHPGRIEQLRRLHAERPRSLAAGRVQWQAARSWDAWDRLGAIPCPTLVLHGTADRLIDSHNGMRIARAIPGAELHLMEGAGHAIHVEQPAAAAAVVLAFLDRVDRGPA